MSHDDKNKKSKNIILDDEHEILLDHDYDGIQELDNSLPQWWLMTFYGAVVFSFFYVGYFHFWGGPSLSEELEVAMQPIYAQQKAVAAEREKAGEAEIMALLNDAEAMKMGAEVYTSKCAVCHLADGGGLIGPNLTDEFFIHDPSIKASMKLIAEGVLDKGMPPWGPVLSNDELKSVAVYITKFVGTTPANPKAPQGEKRTN